MKSNLFSTKRETGVSKCDELLNDTVEMVKDLMNSGQKDASVAIMEKVVGCYKTHAAQEEARKAANAANAREKGAERGPF